MSTSDLTKFPGGTQDKGINTFDSDISPVITWDESTNNVTGGVRRGVGVRYGVAPLAGHSNTETPTGTQCNGIVESSSASGQGLIRRRNLFGIVPLTIAAYDGAYPKVNSQYYIYLVGLLDETAFTTIDACVGATLSSSVNKQSSTIVAGLAQSSYREESPLVRRHKTELLNLPQSSTPVASDMQAILAQPSSKYWAPYAHISISGKRVPYQWMLSAVVTNPAATTAPALNIWTAAVTSGLSPTIYCGAPSEIITRENTSNNSRLYTVYCLDTSGYFLDLNYTATITQADTVAVGAYGTSAMYSVVTATKAGAYTTYGQVELALINDPGSFTNSKHEAILVAGETPFAIVYQDWLMAVKGFMPRWVDLTNPGCTPRPGMSRDTRPNGAASAFYELSLVEGGAGTGFLRIGVPYDIGFSFYNKLLDYETNVAFGVQDEPVADYTCLLFNMGGATGAADTNLFKIMMTTNIEGVPWDYSDGKAVGAVVAPAGGSVGRGKSINDYEIRFYYRETGASEWLPAGSYDAAKFWFYAEWEQYDTIYYGPAICVAASGALPGGQPNGFIDYSPLPKQRYICTVVFQNRAFWWSEKTMQFSLPNNIYAYPTRNTISSQTGKWRGGIVHIRSGQVDQTSRLVVFGDTAFVGRFTGSKTLQNIRISTETIGQFEVDGSDFVLDYLSDATAFSYRSAVVAEGTLYFWGPQGVYQDDGITTPKKISGIYEPDILQFVDMSKDSEVHCVYNKRTSEVVWFYPPKVADSTYPTYLLIFNVENGNFYNGKMRCKVDSSQILKIENDSSPSKISGERVMIHCRETTSSTTAETFYFDDLILAGEQGPARNLLVKTIATPATGQRRLTLAAGSPGITAGGIAVNDLLSFQNVKGYATSLTDADDMIAKIIAVDNSNATIDIVLPTGAALDGTASLDQQLAFPIYHMKPAAAGLHGITYTHQTNYWLPDGLSNSWNWVYLYFLFKYLGIPTPTDPFTSLPIGAQLTLAYRTLVSGAAISDTLKLRNNSDGQAQIHHPLRNVNRSAQGQALKYGLSGIHIGNPWTLEYLEAHCLKERGFTLKEFEG